MYDYDQTIELLQRAVAEKGDGHTARCMYQRFENAEPTGEPVCIVGHVLAYVKLLDLAVEGEPVNRLRLPLSEHFTDNAMRALDVAQWKQDENDTWGEALVAAKGIEL